MKYFEPWEDAFIQLIYQDFTCEEIGKHLGRSRASIQGHAKAIGVCKVTMYPGFTKGWLTVIELHHNDKKYGNYWTCKCKCGNKVVLSVNAITCSKTVSCGCYKLHVTKQRAEKARKNSISWFNALKNRSIDRDIKWEVTPEYLLDLYEKQNSKCALSGLPIKLRKDYKGEKSTASLDRIDSKGDYSPGNVQWLHRDVNYMKQFYSQDYFIQICKMIAETFPNIAVNRDIEIEFNREAISAHRKARRKAYAQPHKYNNK